MRVHLIACSSVLQHAPLVINLKLTLITYCTHNINSSSALYCRSQVSLRPSHIIGSVNILHLQHHPTNLITPFSAIHPAIFTHNMAYLSRTAQAALVAGAIASTLILFLVCLYLYSRDRQEDLESRERQKQELEKRPSEYEQQQWETVSADASTPSNLSLFWAPTPTQDVRRHQGYVISETCVMEPHTARIEYAR
ncbi:hypothetical protein F4782DRAFT_241550 [Xylaria castorea]|nr:hypothetical protein F4782DRAFT_241550 [Xylaria castorea]